jgi:hypothetical protein
MRRLKTLALIVPCALLASCSGTTADNAPATTEAGPCRNEGLERFVGRKADEALGVELLKVSRAKTLRWGPPGSAMTMDFRPDRLTISYDDAMTVTRASCG